MGYTYVFIIFNSDNFKLPKNEQFIPLLSTDYIMYTVYLGPLLNSLLGNQKLHGRYPILAIKQINPWGPFWYVGGDGHGTCVCVCVRVCARALGTACDP